jgi:hypothetical protein
VNTVTVIHVIDPHRNASEIPGLAPPGELLVVEAPDELASDLESRGASLLQEAVTPSFRKRYYEALEDLLLPQESAWRRELPDAVREVVESAALSVAMRTWREAELLLHLGSRAGAGGIDTLRIVTDNEVGRELGFELHAIASAFRHLTVDVRWLGSRSGSLRRPRRSILLAQDALHSSRVRNRRSLSQGEHKPSIAFYTDSPRVWTHLRPIYRQLISDGATSMVLATRTPMAHRLRSEGIPVAFAPPRPISRGFQAELRRQFASLPVAAGLAFPNAETTEAMRRVLFLRTKQVAGRTLALRRAVRRLTRDNERVCFIHAAYAEATGCAVTWEAQARGRSTALVPHGLIDHTRPELRFFPPADMFLAWGDQMRDDLMRSELPARTEVVAVGWPHLESSLERHQSPTDQGDPDGHRRIVLVAFGRPSRVVQRATYEAAAREVLETSIAREDLKFVIKVHPADSSGFWQSLVGERYKNVEVLEKGNLEDVLASAWVVVTRHSTAGAEAICAGKPLVVVDISEDGMVGGNSADYVSFGAAYTVERPHGLLRILSELGDTGDGDDRLATVRQDYALRFLTTGPGTASERISRILRDIASTGGGAERAHGHRVSDQ